MHADPSAFRTKEQVLADLAKALGFSLDALEANRKGRISSQQFNQFISRCLKPLGMAVLFAALPFILWAGLTGMREHLSFSAGLDAFIAQLMHLGQMMDDQGKLTTLAALVTVLGGLGMAVYNLTRFSPGLYFDLLAREVLTREGRVIAREESTLRPNGRDPIEKYFFDVRTERHEVTLTAYRALESGAMYLMYVLPRSGVLVAMEPKVMRTADAPAADGRSSGSPAPEAEVTPSSPVST